MKAAIAFLFSILVALATAEAAHAGTYDVWSCAGPAGQPLPAHGWKAASGGGRTSSNCGLIGGALSASLDDGQLASGSFARWTFEAPKHTTIAGVTVHRVANASGSANWHRSYFLFRDSPVIAEGYGLDVCAFLNGPCAYPGDAAAPLSDASRYSSSPLSAGRLIASAQCDGSEPCSPQDPAAAGGFAIHRAQIHLADAFPPMLGASPSGSLLEASTVVAGERSASFDGSDLGGGIRAAEVIVDGGVVARTPIGEDANCREPFAHPVPCPATTTGTISVNTAALENGPRRIQVALVDAANNRTLSDPVTVNVHNDKRPNGSHASRGARLTAAFRLRGRKRGAERFVRVGRRSLVIGRLVDRQGTPIGGAELRVTSRIDRVGEREREVARISTKEDGRFRWRTARGPSRFIRITYRTYLSDDAESAAAELKLSVRPSIALSVSPGRVRNGGSILFEGRLNRGPGRARTQVVLEAVGRNVRRRVPVATLRADRRGRFRFRYRFLRSFAPFTYRFRARLIRQATYPYAGGSSRVVVVRIVR